MEKYDIAIIGGGPAGFTSALYYKKLGKTVVLFEPLNHNSLLRKLDQFQD